MSTATFECDFAAPAAPCPHPWEHTVGSGHATLALRADWQAQLARCRRELGFRYVRFHGLLSDDVGTLVKEQGRLVQSFFNADQIVDFLLSIDVRPFVELSFMPSAIASGSDTVFHYRGNVTPPEDYEAWGALIHDLVRHWVERYGADEVSRWFFEVWNEPNLKAFWTGSQADYFRLYAHTAKAIKAVSPRLRVGGPATAANAWIPDFLDFCKSGDVPVDFVSTHHYPTDAFGLPEDDTIAQLAASRRSVLRDQAAEVQREARGKPVHYTEWSTSSNGFDDLHDDPYAAAFIVKTAMEARGLVDGYSYWTFSDIFEESYFSSTPFHGGFGLLTIHGIAKPAYRAFELLHRLGDESLPIQGAHETVDLWVTRKGRRVTIMVTNAALPRHPIQAEAVVLRLRPGGAIASAWVERIDQDHANAAQAWKQMGRPQSLLQHQKGELEGASALTREALAVRTIDETTIVELTMPPQGVALITLELSEPAGPSQRSREEGQRDGDTEMLLTLQRQTFTYFATERSAQNGLVADRAAPGAPASIAAVGLALSVDLVAVERGLLSRSDVIARTLLTLRFLHRSPQGPEPDATGYKGFYYHFLDMATGRRVWASELSTVDTALLIAGVLSAGAYFDGDGADEREIRELADDLYRRVDWAWARDGQEALRHGWTPEAGFLQSSWSEGYSEALILYILALGSPTFPIPPECYRAWTKTFEEKTAYEFTYLYAGPLFIHQLSHVWLDFRGIRDARNREVGFDYFENSRRATLVHQRYAIENPHGFVGYSEYGWGITASDGPGPAQRTVKGVPRKFYGYLARGAPFGPDDGTLSPWAVVASLPFAPDVVASTLHHAIERLAQRARKPGDGFDASFNPTFRTDEAAGRKHWVAPSKIGLNEGPIILMIENHLSGMLWALMRRCPAVVDGLRRAGFEGGWLTPESR